eukprot:494-Amphidinium_carterae.1
MQVYAPACMYALHSVPSELCRSCLWKLLLEVLGSNPQFCVHHALSLKMENCGQSSLAEGKEIIRNNPNPWPSPTFPYKMLSEHPYKMMSKIPSR